MAGRQGSAVWDGDLVDGSGRLTIGADAWTGEYSFRSRFDGVLPGVTGAGSRSVTNPEEVLAAAHAACFSMALSLALTENGHPPQTISTKARVQLRLVDGVPTIVQVDLQTEAEVPGIDQAEFRAQAEEAKTACILSRALAGVEQITLSAMLRS